MLMSSQDYRESLRRSRPRVYVDGHAVESVADEPSLAPGVNALGLSYDYALREQPGAGDARARRHARDQPDERDSCVEPGSC